MTTAAASSWVLASPGGRIEVEVSATDRVRWGARLDGTPLLADSTLSLTVDGAVLGTAPRVRRSKREHVDRWLEPPVARRDARIREAYNELRLDMEGGYALVFRAYDEGVAYRFVTSLPRPEVKVQAEEAVFRFPGATHVYFPKEEGFLSHNERTFPRVALSDLANDALGSIPAVVEGPGSVRIAVSDADVESYPGLWFRGTGGAALEATFPPYPLEETLDRDRNLKVTRAAEYIAVTKGARSYPWRALGIAEKDGDLLTSSLLYLLARPSQVEDTSWIKPGKVPWDWWNANNLYGVDFKSGVNTETYERYIDFASEHGLEYIILDEGWYELGDVLKVVPSMDVEALVAHGREKNVGIILWVVWKSLDDQLEAALDQYAKWGVKGLKIDFMQRDDQKVMDFYDRACRAAARRKMLVDFHGGIRPALLTRTWPNLLTVEGVAGQEQSKWSAMPDPEHDVTIPFTRMFLGPMDFTPGATKNAAKGSFAPIFQEPMSQGTRCHQLAMYVVYESPLQMLADSPSNYAREPEMMAFLGPVPTVWDETRVLEARLGDVVAVAKRKGRDWYVGAMTDWTGREMTIDLSFLPPGRFHMEAFRDGVNADRHGSDYARVASDVDRGGRVDVRLAPGGGWAARLTPID
jgi:alpha-glucosidase